MSLTTRKYTAEVHGAVMGALRAGAGIGRAFTLAGISEPTGRSWVAEGRRDPDGPLGQFAADFERVLADRLVRLEKVVWGAALDDGDVKAAQWLLERMSPAEYSSRQQTDIVVEQRAPRTLETESIEQLEARLGLLGPGDIE